MPFSIRWCRYALVILLALCAHEAVAQDASSVLRAAYEKQVDVLEAVEDFTIVATMEGDMAIVDQMVIYNEKVVDADGDARFLTRVRMETAFGPQEVDDAGPTHADPFAMLRRLYEDYAETITYEGMATEDGEAVHVLYAPDLTDFYRQMAPDDEQELQARDVRFYIDADEHILRKMTADMVMDMGAGPQTVPTATLMRDYRQVGALRYPFRTTTRMANPLTPEQQAEMQAMIEQMEAQLESLPEAQREQVRQMMRGMDGRQQLTQDELETTIVVQDLRVNAGAPEGF